MGKTAFIFPGQGSQYIGMGQELAAHYSSSRETFEQVDAALGLPLGKWCFNGPEELLKLTENTQPAILTASIAVMAALLSEGMQADFVAGHSLGEYTALVAAGSLSLTQAAALVRQRGRFMQEAVPLGRGSMAAVLGLPAETVQGFCEEAAQGQIVSAANLNTPEQTVIAGDAEAVQRAGALAKARGAKRVLPLSVSAPFHCALMRPAQDRLAEDLQRVSFADLRVPLVTNVDAEVIFTGDEAREALIRQVTAPVRWVDSVRILDRCGVKTFVEVGPGKALSGMVKRILPEAAIYNVEDLKSLQAYLANRHV